MEAEMKRTCRTCKFADPTTTVSQYTGFCRAFPPVPPVPITPGGDPMAPVRFPVVLLDADRCGHHRLDEKTPVLVAASELVVNIQRWSRDEFDEFKTTLARRLCWECGRMLDYGEKCHCKNDE